MRKLWSAFAVAIILSLVLGFFIGRKMNSFSFLKKDPVYATVDGQKVQESEVLPLIQNDLSVLEKNIYLLKKKATEQLIRQKLHSSQAPVKEPSLNSIEISDSEIQTFLKERNLSSAKLSNADLLQIRNNLKLQKLKEAEQKREDEVLAQAKITYRIPLPEEVRVEMPPQKDLPHWGKTDAPVQVFYISNFHCPFCRDSEKKLQALKEKYKDQIQIHYRFDVQDAGNSWIGSTVEAALCANDQGQFEAFRQQLFTQKEIQSHGELLLAAKAVNLDSSQFELCLTQGKHKELLEKETQSLSKVSRARSPSFIINGRVRAAQLPIDEISAAIDTELSSN